MSAHARQLSAAQRQYDNASSPLHMTLVAHWRTCPECNGEGAPFPARCPGGCVAGDVNVWMDPLLLLRSARRNAWSPIRGAMTYGEVRQRAFSPVLLPADHAPVALRRAA